MFTCWRGVDLFAATLVSFPTDPYLTTNLSLKQKIFFYSPFSGKDK